MEVQAEMFNRMCSLRTSDMIIDKSRSKDGNDDPSLSLEIFNNELWKDPVLDSSDENYDVNIYENTYDKSNDSLLKDSDL